MTAGCRQSLTLGTLRIQRRFSTLLRVSMPPVSVKYCKVLTASPSVHSHDSPPKLFSGFLLNLVQPVSIMIRLRGGLQRNAVHFSAGNEFSSSFIIIIIILNFMKLLYQPWGGGSIQLHTSEVQVAVSAGVSGSDTKITTPPYSNGVRYNIILSQLYMDSQLKYITVTYKKGLIT